MGGGSVGTGATTTGATVAAAAMAAASAAAELRGVLPLPSFLGLARDGAEAGRRRLVTGGRCASCGRCASWLGS